MLEAVGVSEIEERVYRVLLGRAHASAEDIARAIGESDHVWVKQACESLETRGLVSRVPGEMFVAIRPDVAVEALVLQRQEELERTRLAAGRLLEDFRGVTRLTDPAELVEIVTTREAVHQRFMQLQQGAREELLVFDKPPYTAPLQLNETQLDLLRSGVRCRTIYARAALELDGAIEILDELAAAGEEARVLPELPMKMAIADRKLGLVPLTLDAPGMQEGALLLHPSTLLGALTTLFDALWESAAPIGLDSEAAEEDADALSQQDRRLLALIAAGLKDEAIARQLGLGVRTVRRHVSRIMATLGAETRFQAGLQAAKRGWL
jgi:DNA-binding CsgD family transcriptional regulator/sugar-specific transcriptional regulator TrmB